MISKTIILLHESRHGVIVDMHAEMRRCSAQYFRGPDEYLLHLHYSFKASVSVAECSMVTEAMESVAISG